MVSSTNISPGEKGKISAKVDVRGRAGTISKNIRVFSNDPKRHVVNLSLKAAIKQEDK